MRRIPRYAHAKADPATTRRSGRALVVALTASLLLVGLLGGAVGHAAAAPNHNGPVPYQFANVTSPNAVAAAPGLLVALSSASCSSVLTVDPNGSVSPYATLATNVSRCPAQAVAIAPDLGNFVTGTVYVLQGDVLYEIPAGGGTGAAIAPSLTLPSLSGGSPSLTFDTSGAFGYALLAVGNTKGNVLAISAADQVQAIGSFGTTVAGPSVAPLGFGTVGGDLVAASGGHTTVYAMSPNGSVTSFASWPYAEAVSFVPLIPCSFSTSGDSYFVADASDNALLALPASMFSSVRGLGLVLGQRHGVGVGLLAANGSTSPFLPLTGMLVGAAYVSCPIGVSRTIDLTSRGFGSERLNLLGFDPATDQLVGADPSMAPSEIFLLDGSTGALGRNISVGVDPTSAAYNAKTNELFVADTGSDNLTVLNASTYAQLGSLPTGEGSAPVGVVFNPSNQKLYVANSGNGTVAVYSLADNKFPNQNQIIALGGTPVALTYDPIDNNVYVVGSVGAAGAVWEIHAFDVVAELTLPGGAGGVAVNTTSGLLYVTVPSLNEVEFVAPGATLVVTVSVGDEPTGIAFDAFDGHLVVANYGDGTFSVLAGTQLIDTYLVGTDPGPLVYDPIDHQVYVAADTTLLGLDPRIILGGGG